MRPPPLSLPLDPKKAVSPASSPKKPRKGKEWRRRHHPAPPAAPPGSWKSCNSCWNCHQLPCPTSWCCRKPGLRRKSSSLLFRHPGGTLEPSPRHLRDAQGLSAADLRDPDRRRLPSHTQEGRVKLTLLVEDLQGQGLVETRSYSTPEVHPRMPRTPHGHPSDQPQPQPQNCHSHG